MRAFAKLFDQIAKTQSTNEKTAYLKNYFTTCSDADGAFALFFLSGKRLKRFITGRMLLSWIVEQVSLPLWLIEESYAAVGDAAETVALLLPQKENSQIKDLSLSDWMHTILIPMQILSLEEKKAKILLLWSELSTQEIFVLNKILTGSFRMGVSNLLTIKALSQAFNISQAYLSHRLMGNWQPTALFFNHLKSAEFDSKSLNPYPFYLAYPFQGDLKSLGNINDWLIEWKWDGIRGQAIIRDEGIALWSRGNELISNQFPDLIEAFKKLPPGTVLDGEILSYKDHHPLGFNELQKRLGKKNVSNALMEKVPIIFMVYDILEFENADIRSLPLKQRRSILENIAFPSEKIILSQQVLGSHWQDILNQRLSSREKGTEGLMLKKMDSPYGVGRKKGFWWKFKVDPMTIDAVLMYAKSGSGKRANLFTDYTFGVWKDNELIPIAKAYSGLNQEEIYELDRWIRKNTEEKFGPVRKVKPFHAFEIGFEGIQVSKRHKSEVALRFPRILKWRKDKPIEECDKLTSIKEQFMNET